MVCCGVAQQHRFALTRHQRTRDSCSSVIDNKRTGGPSHTLFLCNRCRNTAQCLHPLGGRVLQEVLDRNGPVTLDRIQCDDLATMASRLANPLCKQRMILTQIGSHHQNALQRGERCNGCAQPADTFWSAEFSVAQTVVDVVTAQAAHQCTRQIQLFHGAVRTHQRADGLGAMIMANVLEAVGNVLQCCLPVHFLPNTALLQHGLSEAIFAIERFVGKTVTVRDPALIHCFILKRNDAHHLVVFDLDDQVCTGRVMRAHRTAA